MSTRVNELREKAARLLEQAAILESVPSNDPFGDGTAVTFTRYVAASLRDVHYVAVRSGGRWFVAGEGAPQNTNLGWNRLIDFVSLEALGTLAVVAATKPMSDLSLCEDCNTRDGDIVEYRTGRFRHAYGDCAGKGRLGT